MLPKNTTTHYPSPRLPMFGENPPRAASLRGPRSGSAGRQTRTDLSKWFIAAYLMGRDKRGVSAKFLQRELGVAYQTAWTMAHKLRHGLSEDPARPLRGFLEADETFIGGRGGPASRGRSTANPDKSVVVAAVEKVPAPQNKKGKHAHAVKRQHGFFAGNARIAVLPAATGAELGAFLKESVAAGSHLLTDGFAGYRGRDAALGEHLKHTPVVQDEAAVFLDDAVAVSGDPDVTLVIDKAAMRAVRHIGGVPVIRPRLDQAGVAPTLP